jgi:hypothetical protein
MHGVAATRPITLAEGYSDRFAAGSYFLDPAKSEFLGRSNTCSLATRRTTRSSREPEGPSENLSIADAA